jgi:large subunit ribosomal protein L15
MQIQEIKLNSRKSKRVGRGGKRGKTAGRGHKGQKARAGNSTRPEMRDIIKRIPKLRGHGKNRARTYNPSNIGHEPVNVGDLEKNFEKGASVTPRELLSKGLVKKQDGRVPEVKILAKGDISKALTISGCSFSISAEDKIKKAGGVISNA